MTPKHLTKRKFEALLARFLRPIGQPREGDQLGPQTSVQPPDDVSGGGVKKCLEADMVKNLSEITQRFKTRQEREKAIETELAHYYTHVSWTEPYYRAVGTFWELIPRLTSLAAREQLAYPDIRIVFWFDN